MPSFDHPGTDGSSRCGEDAGVGSDSSPGRRRARAARGTCAGNGSGDGRPAPPARLGLLSCCVLASAGCAAPWTSSAIGPGSRDAATTTNDGAGWRFVVEPYVWIPSTSGTGTTDTTPPLEIDLVGTLDAAFPLALGVQSPDGPFSAIADGFYVRLEDDEGALRTTTEAVMIEGGVGLALDERRNWDALVGLRYVDIDYAVGLGAVEGSAEETWVDPWIGARGRIPLHPSWAVRLRGDVGGFGVGSELSWQAIVLVVASIGDRVSIDVGYRAIGLDFDDGDLAYDVVFHGPVVGVAFAF